MVVHCSLADKELRGDHLVGRPFGDQPKNLQLTGAEAIRVVGSLALVGRGGLGQAFELRDRAGHPHLTGVLERLPHQL
jgi:hypothetical protein